MKNILAMWDSFKAFLFLAWFAISEERTQHALENIRLFIDIVAKLN